MSEKNTDFKEITNKELAEVYEKIGDVGRTVPFTPEDVKAYLDKAIMFWRGERSKKNKNAEIAIYYIDAFQSVRVSLFGSTLEKDVKDAAKSYRKTQRV